MRLIDLGKECLVSASAPSKAFRFDRGAAWRKSNRCAGGRLADAAVFPHSTNSDNAENRARVA
jgi:hypothetical protein